MQPPSPPADNTHFREVLDIVAGYAAVAVWFAVAIAWAIVIIRPRKPHSVYILQHAPLVLCVVFVFLVVPDLRWWLECQIKPPAQALASQYGQSSRRLATLWLHVWTLGLVLYRDMHRALVQRGAIDMELRMWALAAAVCAPLAYVLCSVAQVVARDQPVDGQAVDDEAERREAWRQFNTRWNRAGGDEGVTEVRRR